MRVIFLVVLFVLNLCAQEISVVSEIKRLDLEITLLKNSASSTKELEKSKQKLLNQLLKDIINQKLDPNLAKFHRQNVENLTKKMEIQIKNGDKEQAKRKNAELCTAKLDEIFYSAVIKIQNNLAKNSSSNEIKNIIQNALLSIQIENLHEAKLLINSGLNFKTYNTNRSTYVEILNHLLKNSKSISRDLLFTKLKFREFIDFINSRCENLSKNGINSGKILLITLILTIFYAIRRFLASILYLIFSSILRDKTDSQALKEEHINSLKRPLGVILITYGAYIYLIISYYPSPLPNALNFAFWLIHLALFTWLVAEIFNGYLALFAGNFAKSNRQKEVLNLGAKFIYLAAIIAMILLILQKFGFDISAVLTSLGIGGIIIALATQNLISNFFSSLLIIFDNSFSNGDRIVCAGADGNVVEIGLRKTIIRTGDNALISVPNSLLVEKTLTNISKRKVGRLMNLVINLSPNTDIERLENSLQEIRNMLLTHEQIARSKKEHRNYGYIDDLLGYKGNLFVGLSEFGEFGVQMIIYCYTKDISQIGHYEIRQEIMTKSMEILTKNGIEIATPRSNIYVKKIGKKAIM